MATGKSSTATVAAATSRAPFALIARAARKVRR